MNIILNAYKKTTNIQPKVYNLGSITTTLQNLLDNSTITIDSKRPIVLSINDLDGYNHKYMFPLNDYDGNFIIGLGKDLKVSDLIEIYSSTPGVQGAQGVQGPAGPLGPVGPAGLTWKGAWVSGTSYVANDAVGYGGASYFCILATSGTSNPSVATTNWALLASQGSQGIQGVQGPTGPQGPAGGTGTLQQTVNNGNVITDAFSGDTTTIFGGGISVSNIFGNSGLSPYELQFKRGDYYGFLQHPGTFTADRTYTLPNTSGTIALTSDVTLQNTLTNGNVFTSNGFTTTITSSAIKVGESSTTGMTLNPEQVIFEKNGGTELMILQFPTSLSGIKQITLPNSTGTVALTSQLPTVSGNYANDAAAASGGIAVGGMYHTSGVVKIRLT